ncbi:coiled-coil domain-containing protein 8 isoform X3 [Marmota marmota marmota]|uniref:coiled-coil domain-containing protein 8 isoform X3 n=1 Tax=Marmota marmota marmota TaxID=9994 RepID=UPI002092D52E|nr:coiled-coil domain-containing protein 8 isoform X3 [Marmota marmota marmota]
MLQIGEDVDYLLIPREVRLAGGVWRVISKPATKEAEFRERLIQFLEEEGRTLEDVARVIEKSTPHPPQPPKKPKEPQVRRRVQQMVPPPPRLVVGTFDSSNASDSDFSDFETSRAKGCKGPRSRRKVRKMPVSYLGSKFLGSDLESEDDEELVEAFLRRGEKKPSAPPVRRRVNLPVPMFENNSGPPQSKADRWREYVSQVSWGKLKRRVKGWAPRSGPEVGEAPQASPRAERDGASGPNHSASPRDNMGNAGDRSALATSSRRWRPKINWASFRRRRKGEAASPAPEADIPADQRAEGVHNQGAEAPADQRAEAPADQGAGAPAADIQRAGVPADQGAEVPADQGAGVPADQGAGVPADQRARASGDQREEAGEAQAIQEAEALAGLGAAGAAPGAGARKQVKTVRFQTPGRFSWFRKRRRAFWHTPRLPTLPKRVPRAGEARNLRVLRAEARAEAEQGEQEDQL